MAKKTKNKKCLSCYEPIEDSIEFEYHNKCSIKLFQTQIPPVLPYELSMISDLASQEINKRLSITGVQPKISLGTEKEKGQNRLTIAGLWGGYILKPPFAGYPEMTEIEDMTMHLAEISGIQTSVHGLIRFQSGELGFITKRFDRSTYTDKDKDNDKRISGKIYTEDFCQLTETMTVNKYISSMEKIGKTIQEYSEYSGLDKIRFFEITLFCFLTGNADMHLKNFSLYRNQYNELTLSPAYDLIASKLLIPEDNEESALTINGKKSNLRRKDFISLAENLDIGSKVTDTIFEKMSEKIGPMINFLDKGFLSEYSLKAYKKLLHHRASRLDLI